MGSSGYRTPPGEGWPTSRKRVLRGARVTGAAKRRQRVDRPCDGAPKWDELREPTPSESRKAMRTRREGLTRFVPPGSESRACPWRDPPGTWEASSPPSQFPEGNRVTNPRLRCEAPLAPGSECVGARRYGRAKPCEARWEGRRGVGGSRSTGEAGEFGLRRPGGGKGVPRAGNRARERCRRHRAPSASQRNSSG